MGWEIKELNVENFELIFKYSINVPVSKDPLLFEIPKFVNTERYDPIMCEFIPNMKLEKFSPKDIEIIIKEYDVMTNGIVNILIDWIQKIKLLNGHFHFFVKYRYRR